MNVGVTIDVSALKHHQHAALEVAPRIGQIRALPGQTPDAKRAEISLTYLNLGLRREDRQARNGSIPARGKMRQNHLRRTEIPVDVIFSHHIIDKIQTPVRLNICLATSFLWSDGSGTETEHG